MDDSQPLNFKNVLAIGAHPDDIEYGCLGFLMKQSRRGAKISTFTSTLGSEGDPSSGLNRKSESVQALQMVPVTNVVFREKVGLTPADFNHVLDDLYKAIQRIQPDLILTMSAHDTHQEHRLVHEITLAAARRSKASILCYSILSNTLQFSPSLFVDIESEYSEKKKALRMHASQSDKYYMSDEYLEIFHSHNYASLHGLRYCEAFELVRFFT